MQHKQTTRIRGSVAIDVKLHSQDTDRFPSFEADSMAWHYVEITREAGGVAALRLALQEIFMDAVAKYPTDIEYKQNQLLVLSNLLDAVERAGQQNRRA